MEEEGGGGRVEQQKKWHLSNGQTVSPYVNIYLNQLVYSQVKGNNS
jgi:hypothetical protein